MIVGQLATDGLLVAVFHSAGSEHADQDRWMVQPFADVLRVAAIDGVTPWRGTECPGQDAGQWAASSVLGSLSLPMSIRDALGEANARLHPPEITPSRRQNMCAVAAADCRREDAAVSFGAVVAADCEVWVAESGRSPLVLAAGGDYLRPDVRREWEQRQQQLAGCSFDELLLAESHLLDDPDTQICHAVGRYAHPEFRSTSGVANTVVLASDGACLQEAADAGVGAHDFDTWLASVESRPVRDDFTCLRITVA
ncbi:MAG: hypothetical protein WCP28_10035 [Actinomycetes bacterium]